MEGATASTGAAPTETAASALTAFAAAALELVRGVTIDHGLRALVRAVALGTGADVVVARLAVGDGQLVARAVDAESSALTAEVEGTPISVLELGELEVELTDAAGDPAAPAGVRRVAARAGAPIARLLPVVVDGTVAAALELYRSGLPFGPEEEGLARAAAAHLALALRLESVPGPRADAGPAATVAHLEPLGEALAAGADEEEAAEQVARIAGDAAGAAGALVWRVEADAPPALLATHGFGSDGPDVEAARAAVQVELDTPSAGAHPLGRLVARTIRLGEPPVAVLQLAFDPGAPGEPDLEQLSPFAVRAAVALARSRRVGLDRLALERSQTLAAVIGQAIARLSLSHTLETAVERVAELTGSGHVAVYLREEDRLVEAASRGLAGTHTDLAERLLELALGPFRSRGFLFIQDLRTDPRLAGLEHVLEQSDIRRALFVPLLVRDEVIGALAVFRTRVRPYRDGEEGLLIALSSQLAVAVQNARLHERAKELSSNLERSLESERRAARQLRALYAITQSFAESLSYEATLEAIARTMVELLDVDVAVIRMPDARNEWLTTRAAHVADARAREVAGGLLTQPQPVDAPLVRRLLRSQRPIVLARGVAAPEDVHRVLEPFLQKGATAAVIPLATPGEVLGTLTLVSFDADRPVDRDGVDTALAVAAQAALAIDNARLYEQQKNFAETMQRSLLPRELPRVRGLELGHVYESSARLDVGGDLYDFAELDGGRLAVIVGDVLGKGVEAAADMAMTKFGFRVLVRAGAKPGSFLESLNEVVADELDPGEFVTAVYAVIDPSERTVWCACAGHPPARLVRPDGRVRPLGASGLVLGIERGQEYRSERADLEPGSAIVLYTDGVLEARRDGELYGMERLDRVVAENYAYGAQHLADAILADCRSFSGGDLADDCAIVCVKLAR
jgi:serine phosphatase RsbU (regulator of sigma subunit)